MPKRPNIIVSRSGILVEGAHVATSLQQALEIAGNYAKGDEIMLIGGGELFKQAMPLAEKLYLTEIQARLEGDTFFEFAENEWQVVSEQLSEIDEKNPYRCRFLCLERKSV